MSLRAESHRLRPLSHGGAFVAATPEHLYRAIDRQANKERTVRAAPRHSSRYERTVGIEGETHGMTDLLNPSAPLLAPVMIPRPPASRVKHHQRSNEGEQG
jgi:hypothetical protein